MIDCCAMCGDEIVSPDYMIAIERHVPGGRKGCSVEFRFVTAATAGDAPALGSLECAVEYFAHFATKHMRKDFTSRSSAS